jgi:hypothetical protein
MYAQMERLAIDGKAMYFGGAILPLDLGLRPSEVANQCEADTPKPAATDLHGFKRIGQDKIRGLILGDR